VLPSRGTRGIEKAGLSEENEGAFGVATMAHGVFRRGDFLEAAAEMHGGGTRAVWHFPRNRIVEGVIDFEDARAVAVLREATCEASGETVARDAEQLVRGYITEDGVVICERRQILNACGKAERATQ